MFVWVKNRYFQIRRVIGLLLRLLQFKSTYHLRATHPDHMQMRTFLSTLAVNCVDVKNKKLKINRPLAIISTYNDIDIISAIIYRVIKEGFDVYVIDNWSSDGTWEVCKKINMITPHCLGAEQYPLEGDAGSYEWKKILDRKAQVASRFPDRWIFHQDSDEITLSPLQHVDVKTVLHVAKTNGYNAISLCMLDFRAVDDSFKIGDPFEYFKYYEFSDIPSYQLQNKGWYQADESVVDLSCMGGHDVLFDGRSVYPVGFPRLHYSIRGSLQHNKKIEDRLERSRNEREKYGWHTHIDKLKDQKIIFDKKDLLLFDRIGLYEKFPGKFFYHA